MNREVLLAMLEKWDREVSAPSFNDGKDKIRSAEEIGHRKGLERACADLRDLLRLLGDPLPLQVPANSGGRHGK